MEWVSDQGSARARLNDAQVFCDRVHRHRAPVDVLFRALTDKEAKWWLQLQPGEVEPEVLEAVPFEHVVWSSFWPVSPEDTIVFDISGSGPRCSVRFRWFSDSPPDDRGIGITRQRLNRKFGADIRSVVSDYYWSTREP